MKVESESEVTQSCPTLSDPMDCRLPGSSIRGIFRATVLEWGAIAFSWSNIQNGLKEEKEAYIIHRNGGLTEMDLSSQSRQRFYFLDKEIINF